MDIKNFVEIRVYLDKIFDVFFFEMLCECFINKWVEIIVKNGEEKIEFGKDVF